MQNCPRPDLITQAELWHFKHHSGPVTKRPLKIAEVKIQFLDESGFWVPGIFIVIVNLKLGITRAAFELIFNFFKHGTCISQHIPLGYTCLLQQKMPVQFSLIHFHCLHNDSHSYFCINTQLAYLCICVNMHETVKFWTI